jgi:stage V sporulation protein AC
MAGGGVFCGLRRVFPGKGGCIMNMNPKEYSEYVKKMGPKSPIWKDCFNAFWTGGLICLLGQLIQNGYVYVQK